AQLPDVTLRPDGTLAPVQETTWMGGATWHATPLFDWYVYGGQEAQQHKYFDVGTLHLGLGNPSYNLAGCLVEGGSCSPTLPTVTQVETGCGCRAYRGKSASVRAGPQYPSTHLPAFAGAGGVRPTTDDNMVFTSLRYYPF